MRLERIKLNGFGSFNEGIDVELGDDRLSLIIGRNEAGKSTLMSAIFGLLFGFKDSALQKKFEPWDEYREYSGELRLTDEEGRQTVIKRNFADHTAEIGEIVDGAYEPVFLGSANPRGHTDEDVEYFQRIEKLVGFQDESIFRGTVFVGQSALQTSITDQIRKLVSGSSSTDFKGVLHDLHSRFADLTTENPWRTKTRAKPREIEKVKASLDDHVKRLEEARENFMKTISLEQEVKKLGAKQAANKSELEDNRSTLSHFERFCKLIRDRDAARERFAEANKRRETFGELKKKVAEIDDEIKSRLARFATVGEEFPELVTQLKSETRELEHEEAVLLRDKGLLKNLRPAPNNKIGGMLASLGLVVGAVAFQITTPPIGILTMVVLGTGLFFAGRQLSTGFKERQAELEQTIKLKSLDISKREEAIRDIIESSDGILGKNAPDDILKRYRRFRSLSDDRARRISSMQVLGDWSEIEATFEKNAEENLRCNGLMELILENAPYLTEISEDAVAVARNMEELKRRIGELTEEIEISQEVLTEAKIDLARATTDVDYDLPAIEDSVSSDEHKLNKLEIERDSLRIVIDTLEECVTEFQEGDLTKLSSEVSTLVRDITGNRYTRVTLSPNMEPMLTKFDNTHIHPDDLSQGTQDQLYFAIRVAIARHLSKSVALPFFLDDPFVNFDRERLEVTKELLDKLQDHQVVMVTCDRAYENWSDSILDLDMARAEATVSNTEGYQLSPQVNGNGTGNGKHALTIEDEESSAESAI